MTTGTLERDRTGQSPQGLLDATITKSGATAPIYVGDRASLVFAVAVSAVRGKCDSLYFQIESGFGADAHAEPEWFAYGERFEVISDGKRRGSRNMLPAGTGTTFGDFGSCVRVRYVIIGEGAAADTKIFFSEK